jgi:hypothetical protein
MDLLAGLKLRRFLWKPGGFCSGCVQPETALMKRFTIALLFHNPSPKHSVAG